MREVQVNILKQMG